MKVARFQTDRSILELALNKAVNDIINFATEKFNSQQIPEVEFAYSYYKKSRKGHTAVTNNYKIKSYPDFQWEHSEWILSNQSFRELQIELEKFLHKNGVENENFPISDLAKPMLVHYFSEENYFKNNPERIKSVVQSFINDITSREITEISIYNIENFKSYKSFVLDDGIEFNPIDAESLALFSQDKYRSGPHSNPYIKGDSWLCVYKKRIRKKDIYSTHEIRREFENKLLISLTLLDCGAPGFRLLQSRIESYYLGMGIHGSSIVVQCGFNGKAYINKNTLEIFSSYYLSISNKKTKEYYHSVFERIRDSLNRGSHKDRFVDLVIILEMLLASDTDHLESTYRFKFRGAYLTKGCGLGVAKVRLRLFSDIYNLRSAIVHGPKRKNPSKEIDRINKEVNRLMPTLRKITIVVMRWYLDHMDKYPDKLLSQLDEIMVDAPVGKSIQSELESK
ncbi:MAG: hypothetical protein HQ556_01795 [Candidatus Marinimicrobia bacterium]|nr:hypothetical protein [Candidatus Neomarinimicrobiota bacterium]